jgi:hypothetical protein
MSDTPEANLEEAKLRAEWLNKHKAPQGWLILTESELATIREEFSAMEGDRNEAIAMLNDPHRVHAHWLREGIGWEAWTTERVRDLERRCEEAQAERDILRLDAQREAEHHDRMVKELEGLHDKIKKLTEERARLRETIAELLHEPPLKITLKKTP